MRLHLLILALLAIPLAAQQTPAPPLPPASITAPSTPPTSSDSDHALAREIFQQLININTTHSVGNTTTAAQAMADRLIAAGFPADDVQVLAPEPAHGNLVVRYRAAPGSGSRQPILFIGHLDVVEANRSDWSVDPFTFLERDGYFYGRGTQDMKVADAALVAVFIRLRRENFVPDRDLILALTAGEEGGPYNGVDWLLKNHRDLINAEFVINPDSGGIWTGNNEPAVMEVEATEKLYADFQFSAINAGGHSSLPTSDNAIYHVADALSALQQAPFPVELNAVTRAYFEQMAALDSGQMALDMRAVLAIPPSNSLFELPAGQRAVITGAINRLSLSPRYNATLRTTCIPTMLAGGHAPNALPQDASANINCRILPGHSPQEVMQRLTVIANDPALKIRYANNEGKPQDTAPTTVAMKPPPPAPAIFGPLHRVVNQLWPNLPIVPEMETGASDSIYTMAAGIPSYGINGFAIDRNDIRFHGKDERVPVASYYKGYDFFYLYLKALSTP